MNYPQLVSTKEAPVKAKADAKKIESYGTCYSYSPLAHLVKFAVCDWLEISSSDKVELELLECMAL